ncbi:MAG: malate dehydrogenase, partial [Duncaniella sp.]|nr:malate dehydrogenase [Duncaniella sp.]
HIPADEVVNSRTYGGHGEQMAVFASTSTVAGQPLSQIIGTKALPEQEWEEMKQRVIQGGKNIIDLRGRSSFQSPAYLSIEMIAAAMGGKPFTWPVGTYVDNGTYNHIMMAMETTVDKNGVQVKPVEGTPEEKKELDQSYHHLCTLRDEVISLGIIPPISKWSELNPNL